MKECIFCKIVKGEIPSASLIENETVMSFLDINPVNHGHALVIPKKHVETLIEAEQAVLENCILTARQVAEAILGATGAEGFNILQNNGRCSGQVVPHLHFHVIPRWSDDGFSLGWRQGRYEDNELDSLLEDIKQRL